jgi:hypothetical protein
MNELLSLSCLLCYNLQRAKSKSGILKINLYILRYRVLFSVSSSFDIIHIKEQYVLSCPLLIRKINKLIYYIYLKNKFVIIVMK